MCKFYLEQSTGGLNQGPVGSDGRGAGMALAAGSSTALHWGHWSTSTEGRQQEGGPAREKRMGAKAEGLPPSERRL